MRRASAKIGIAFSIAAFPTMAVAAADGAAQSLREWSISLPLLEQRQDVREVSLPRPAQGPATPHPFCTPAQPICP